MIYGVSRSERSINTTYNTCTKSKKNYKIMNIPILQKRKKKTTKQSKKKNRLLFKILYTERNIFAHLLLLPLFLWLSSSEFKTVFFQKEYQMLCLGEFKTGRNRLHVQRSKKHKAKTPLYTVHVFPSNELATVTFIPTSLIL